MTCWEQTARNTIVGCRGKIRLEGIKETNPVAVGDRVTLDLEHEIASITEILPRKNHILRQSVKKTGHAHVLAANVTQALLSSYIFVSKNVTGIYRSFSCQR